MLRTTATLLKPDSKKMVFFRSQNDRLGFFCFWNIVKHFPIMHPLARCFYQYPPCLYLFVYLYLYICVFVFLYLYICIGVFVYLHLCISQTLSNSALSGWMGAKISHEDQSPPLSDTNFMEGETQEK